MTYLEKLKDPRWQRRRLEIFKRDGFACQHCGDTLSPLNVHHTEYRRGAEPWDYEDELLVTLCEQCHPNIEALRKCVLRHLGDRNLVVIYEIVATVIQAGYWPAIGIEGAKTIQKYDLMPREQLRKLVERVR